MTIRLTRECGELIEHQSGVLARWQAPGSAIQTSGVDALLRRGRWQTLYRGVYAAYTGEPSRESALWAAVLRCGPGAALSHFTAAEQDGLSGQRSAAIHVTTARQLHVRISDSEYGSGRPRIVVHRSARIAAARHPARTPPRTRIEETVLDLTQLARTPDGVFTWLSLACARRLVTPDQLRAAAARRVNLRWRADILLAIGDIGDGVCSHLERRYYTSVERAHKLPKALRQARMARGPRSAYLDNLYSAFGLAVELDGRAAHPVESRWLDIHRDNFFASSGIVTLRYSWADITGRPCHVAGQIATALRLRGWAGVPQACRPSCPVAPDELRSILSRID